MHCNIAILTIVVFLACATQGWSSSVAKRNTDHSSIPKGPCYCGLFTKRDISGEKTPLLSKSYMNVTCDVTGSETCSKFCKSLAQASKDRATAALCQNLGHADKITPSMFTQACNAEWVYSGITADEPLCCHDKKNIPCDSATVAP